MSTVLLIGSDEAVGGVGAALRASDGVGALRAHDAVGALETLSTRDVACVAAAPETLDGVLRRARREGFGGPAVALLPADADLASAMSGDADAVAPLADPDAAAARVRDVLTDARIDAERAARRRTRETIDRAAAACEDAPHQEDAVVALCESLTADERYRTAWVGRYDRTADAVTPVAAAGLDVAHLDGVGADAGPTAAAVDGEVATTVEGGRTTAVVPLGESPWLLYLHADRELAPDERDRLSVLGDRAGAALAGDAEDSTDRFAVFGDVLAHELSNNLEVATMHLELARERDDPSHFGHVEGALSRMTTLADDARSLARDDLAVTACDLDDVARAAWAVAADGGVAADGERADGDASPPGDDGGAEAPPEAGDADTDLDSFARSAAAASASASDGPDGPGGPDAPGDDAETADDAGADGASLDVEAGSVDADEALLSLLLENLFRNAVEHAGPDVRVTVGTLDDGGFYVADDGAGIPADERERVLEWGHSSAGGTGVGLGIVSLVAERHDWAVSVDESAAGGARFEFDPR